MVLFHACFYKLQSEKRQTGFHMSYGIDQFVQNQVPQGDVQQTEADNDQSHDRTGTECDSQAFIQAFAGALSGTGGRIGGGFHTEETAQAAEKSASQECDGNKGVLHAFVRQKCEDRQQHNEDQCYDLVLAEQIRIRTFTHVRGNFDHGFGAFRGAHHLLIEVDGKAQSQDRAGDREVRPPRT